jgi:hypothetical protein
MVANLKLNFDFRDQDAVAALEDSFGLTFDAAATGCWRTVGDVEDAVVAHVVDQESRIGACLSAMAFYRLRRLLRAADGRPIRPSQRIRDVTALSPKKLSEALVRAGLAPPSYGSVRVMLAGVFAVGSLGAIVMGFVEASIMPAIAGAVGLALSGFAAATAQGHYSSGLTVGDVSLMVVDLNVARLAAQGGRVDERSARRAVRRILAEVADCDMLAITRSTKLVT